MTPAESYVQGFYCRFAGRIPLSAGWSDGNIYPLVFEDESGKPIGLVAMAANASYGPNTVQVYLIASFLPRRGDGSKILKALCAEADDRQIELLLQAESLGADKRYFTPQNKLIAWYRSFGFTGGRVMVRKPETA